MTDSNLVEFVFEQAAGERAAEMWEALRNRGDVLSDPTLPEAISTPDVMSEWSNYRVFEWEPLEDVRIHHSEAKSAGEQTWCVPDSSDHVELHYGTDPLTEALIHDRGDEMKEYVDALQDLVAYCYEAVEVKPFVAYSPSSSHLDQLAGDELPLPVTKTDLDRGTINYSCWLTLFPPSLVATYGREKLMQVDVYSRRELNDGAILIVAYENPIEIGQTQHIDRQLGLSPPNIDDEELAY